MSAIRTKCVNSPIDLQSDGLRILVTRYIPRGCPHTRYQVWMANLSPSERLLRTFLAGNVPWKDFARSYETEIFEAAAIDQHNPRIKNHGQKFTLRLLKELARHQPITLMCSCHEDDRECHRHVLKAILDSSKI